MPTALCSFRAPISVLLWIGVAEDAMKGDATAALSRGRLLNMKADDREERQSRPLAN